MRRVGVEEALIDALVGDVARDEVVDDGDDRVVAAEPLEQRARRDAGAGGRRAPSRRGVAASPVALAPSCEHSRTATDTPHSFRIESSFGQ